MGKSSKSRRRKDHYLPRGYLHGFIHPARNHLQKRLWHYDVHLKKWEECSEGEVGFEIGFYDPIGPGIELEIADETFAELERKFPPLIKELAAGNFEGWRYHFRFLLHFMQMIRARSPLFFQHTKADFESKQAYVVTASDPLTNRVDLKPQALPAAFIKNQSLRLMREEIIKGPDRLREFDWALRWTDDPDDLCITSEQPFAMEYPVRPDGTAPTMAEAFEAEETFLLFPLCWQAVLFGSRRRITDPPTDGFHKADLRRIRNTYFTKAQSYIVSPLPLDAEGQPFPSR